MTTAGALDRGRRAFDTNQWAAAHAELSALDRQAPLDATDLERLATAAYLVGRDAESVDIWTRAHNEHLARGDVPRAARCAFWLGFELMHIGEHARAGGWFARASRLLDAGGHDCVEQGYLLFPSALKAIGSGDLTTALHTFSRAAEISARFGDQDLVALARHGRGRVLIRMGRTADGLALLDEVMVAVTLDELSPLVVGDVYCSVIEACHEIFDLRRAQEWTTALSHWCESRPELVPYRGQCLVRRAEIMQLHGAWNEAMDEAERARARLSEPPGQPAIGAAVYLLAELHRVRGEFAAAEEAYRQASQWGRTPRPGLALLRLAQGEIDRASAAIRRMLDETRDRATRARLLAPGVEIMLAANDLPTARLAADELRQTASDLDAPLLEALAAHAHGAVLLHEGETRSALDVLRQAWTTWERLEAPYEAARVRVLLARACRELGDEDSAELELEAARRTFEQLGAAPDLRRVQEMLGATTSGKRTLLTERERQILRLIATGRTNRAIATQLGISEKTVARHVSNIFTKLGLSTRAAATAWAYQHRLV